MKPSMEAGKNDEAEEGDKKRQQRHVAGRVARRDAPRSQL